MEVDLNRPLSYKETFEINARQDGIERLAATALYLSSELGQQEVQGNKGGSGPPTGGSAGATETEIDDFHSKLEPFPREVLM